MTKPIGNRPAAAVLLDDTLFDAQCCGDSQVTNTSHMLERFESIFADGQVTDRDSEDVLYLLRHTRLEHKFNEEQCSLLRWARTHCNRAMRLVEALRLQVQESKKAATQAALQD